jgi:hypothetical protein
LPGRENPLPGDSGSTSNGRPENAVAVGRIALASLGNGDAVACLVPAVDIALASLGNGPMQGQSRGVVPVVAIALASLGSGAVQGQSRGVVPGVQVALAALGNARSRTG